MRFPLARAAVSAGVLALIGVAIASGGVVDGNRPVVVAIGDSIMEGHGLAQGQAWIALLAKNRDWNFTNLASDGSGFLKVGNAGDTFADQAKAAEKLKPDVVIVAGSSNDLGESNTALNRRTMATIAALRAALPDARIIAVSAVWGATTAPAQLTAIDGQVQSAAEAVGGEYIDIGEPLAGHPELMQKDGVHPTAAGQRVLASAVVSALRAERQRA